MTLFISFHLSRQNPKVDLTTAYKKITRIYSRRHSFRGARGRQAKKMGMQMSGKEKQIKKEIGNETRKVEGMGKEKMREDEKERRQ